MRSIIAHRSTPTPGSWAGRCRTFSTARAGAGPADGDLVAYLEGDLAGEHPGDLVAVAVQMEQALGADGHGFFEQHDALIGLVADELQGGEAARRRHVEMLPTARRYDKASCRVHSDVPPCGVCD